MNTTSPVRYGRRSGNGASRIAWSTNAPIARNRIPTPANTAMFDTAVHVAPSLTLRTPSSVRPYFSLMDIYATSSDVIFQLTARS